MNQTEKERLQYRLYAISNCREEDKKQRELLDWICDLIDRREEKIERLQEALKKSNLSVKTLHKRNNYLEFTFRLLKIKVGKIDPNGQKL